jgi:asparagine synthase (glutamine-hydrolysing)
MVYNGEIYNFKEFYPELKVTYFDIDKPDTEVLLKLYELYGLKNAFSSQRNVCICYLG